MKEAAGFLGVNRDKCHEAGKALGCSADVGELAPGSGRDAAEKPPSDDSFDFSCVVGMWPVAAIGFGAEVHFKGALRFGDTAIGTSLATPRTSCIPRP